MFLIVLKFLLLGAEEGIGDGFKELLLLRVDLLERVNDDFIAARLPLDLMQVFLLLLVLHVLLLVVSFGVHSTHMASSKYRTIATASCFALSSYSAVHFLCSELKL